MLLKRFSAVLLCSAPMTLLPAQQPLCAHGTQLFVHDPSGAAIPGAMVDLIPKSEMKNLSLESQEAGLGSSSPRSLTTDQKGVACIPQGAQMATLIVHAQGFFREQVAIVDKSSPSLDATLFVYQYGGIEVTPTRTLYLENTKPVQAEIPQVPDGKLTVKGKTVETFSTDSVASLPKETLTVTNGHTHAKETYSGVPLIALLEKAGAPTNGDFKGKALADYIVATGSDGYKAVLALAEAEPGFHPGTVLVADQLDGKPLDAKEGPWKLVVSEDARPARSVHNLVKVEVREAE